jgi:hydrogenase/urease accessory protein HupE
MKRQHRRNAVLGWSVLIAVGLWSLVSAPTEYLFIVVGLLNVLLWAFVATAILGLVGHVRLARLLRLDYREGDE